MKNRERQASAGKKRGRDSEVEPDDLHPDQTSTLAGEEGGFASAEEGDYAEDPSYTPGDRLDNAADDEWTADQKEIADRDDVSTDALTPDQAAEEELSANRASAPAWDHGRETPAGLVGFFYFLSVLAVAAVAGYTVLHVLGGQIQHLLRLPPSSFALLTTAGGGLVILGLLGALAIGRAAASAQSGAAQAEYLLWRIAQLELSGDEGWQDEDYTIYPVLASNLYRMKSEYELLRARYARSADLESELSRLQQYLARRDRSGLAIKFAHPTADQLAVEALHLIAAEASARDQWEEVTARLEDRGGPLCSDLQQAARWNDTIKCQIHAQTCSLEELGSGLQALQRKILQGQQVGRPSDSTVAILTALQEELAAATTGSGRESAEAVAQNLRDLNENIGNLAFQIAITVARLGQEDNPLVPLTQELEEMTGELKSVAAQLETLPSTDDELVAKIRQASQKLQTLQTQAGLGTADEESWRKAAAETAELVKILQVVAQALSELLTQFDSQTGKLNELGKMCAGLTASDYDSVEPVALEKPGNFTDLGGREPEVLTDLGSTAPAQEMPVAEPLPGTAAGARPFFAEKSPATATTESQLDQSIVQDMQKFFGDNRDLDPFGPANHKEQPTLSPEGDKVYDLKEFGAVAMPDSDASAAAADDRVYDLGEFGAVAIT